MFRQPRTTTNWLEMLEEIKDLREEYGKNASIMTPYERQTAESYITQRRKANRGAVAKGMIADFNAAVSLYQYRSKQAQEARQKEAAGWNAAQLRDEMQLVEMRVRAVLSRNTRAGDDPTGEIQAVYEDARRSGDKYKMRAAAEVLAGVVSMAAGTDASIRMKLNHIEQAARREMPTLRMTEEIQAADKAQQDAEENLLNMHQALDRTAQLLGYPDAVGARGPLSATYFRLSRDEETGALLVRDANNLDQDWVEEWREKFEEGR